MSIVIPIDGPTSSGKSSVGFHFAKKIKFQYVDTGSIYRAGAMAVLKHGVQIDNEEKIAELFRELNIDFREIEGKMHTLVDSVDITESLHNPEVTAVVPTIASYQKVREEATWLQREIASREDTVMVGRDIGTAIFPEAKLKFYLTADIQVRAHRRFDQIRKKVPDTTFEQVLTDMIERDKKDMLRAISPLRIPDGAIIVDTSALTTEQSVEKLLQSFHLVLKIPEDKKK